MKHKKSIIIGVVLLAIVLIVSALVNSTYALFSNDAYGANTNAYTTGMLSIEASSKSETISLTNALPITDEEGLKTNPYVFTVKNIGNLDYLFDIKLLSSGDDSSTIFSPQYIKLQIDDGEVVTLSSLTNGKIKSNVTLFAGDSIDVSIRIWLSIDTPNSEIGKTFNSKIVAAGQAVYTSSNNELKLNGAQYITSLYNSAVKTEVTNNNIVYNQAQSVNLMNDRLGGTTEGYDSGNVRYYGANPKNYIYFNCKDYHRQSDQTCEKWRIIGVFDGKLKLIRNESIGNYAWDSNDNTNNWSTATLNTYLNGDYYSSLNAKNSETLGFISQSTYYLGGYETAGIYSNEIYKYERTNDEGTTILSGNPFTEETNIGIMYASDYGYGTDFNECDRDVHHYNYNECYINDWLYNKNGQWLITPYSTDSFYAWIVSSLGAVNGFSDAEVDDGVSYEFGVRPVLYLNSDVAFNTKGDGTEEKPYQIYVEPYPSVVEYITSLYTKGNPTLITQDVSNDSYYYSYQDAEETWGLMNDGLKVDNSLDATTTSLAVTVADTAKLINGTEGNIRFFGPSASVKNYIYFNCNDYSNQSLTDANGKKNCELWRIIGIVDGKVKIIRNDSIGNLAWDQDKNQDSSLTTYNNNWKTSSLQEFLNGLYYNRGAKDEHTYLSDSYGTTETPLDLESIGITEVTRNNNLISESTWYLGGYDSSSGLYPNDIYNYERQNKVGITIYSTNDFIINKNIGLMYASDYGYATDLSKCRDIISAYDSSTDSYACRTNNWLFNSATQWLNTPISSYASAAWRVYSSGLVYYGGSVYDTRGVRPVLYLNSELSMESGHEGTSTDPYRISV